jgi:hypothetical protein
MAKIQTNPDATSTKPGSASHSTVPNPSPQEAVAAISALIEELGLSVKAAKFEVENFQDVINTIKRYKPKLKVEDEEKTGVWQQCQVAMVATRDGVLFYVCNTSVFADMFLPDVWPTWWGGPLRA